MKTKTKPMKVNDIQITPNFNFLEVECPCCHRIGPLHPLLLERCQRVRDRINVWIKARGRNWAPDVEKNDLMGSDGLGLYILSGNGSLYVPNVRGPDSISLHINSGCRCWDHHVGIYRRKYGAEWPREITFESQHLISWATDEDIFIPGAYLLPEFSIIEPRTKTVVSEFQSKLWICSAVDLRWPRKYVPKKIFNDICREEFDFVQRYPWGCHCDLRDTEVAA